MAKRIIDAPPHSLIERAEQAAQASPCVKSRRGVVCYATTVTESTKEVVDTTYTIVSAECNGPPIPMRCLNNDACKQDCNKRCVHAEARALRIAMHNICAPAAMGLEINQIKMIHVKIGGDGKMVAGGGPSCWQCSREILDANIAGIWLYESRESVRYPAEWVYYSAVDFHDITLANCGIS